MTKEEKVELIELSDLNREDNIKYISSEAQGIAITLNSDRCAPTYCKLERAYICGRRKSEKKIEELDMKRKAERQIFQGIVEKKNEQLTKATELLRFWVNDFYDSFNHSNKYEERHKALVETEQFLKEIEK